MTTTTETLTVLDRQNETQRICDSLWGKISQDERDRLYGTVACLSRSAYNLGQFPGNKTLIAPRESIGAKIADKVLSVFARDIFEFQHLFKEITTFESDAALVSLHNSLNMLEVQTREDTLNNIFALVHASYEAGQNEEAVSKEPMTILGGVSTW